jgi:uncharacterized protein (UPF0303 family)
MQEFMKIHSNDLLLEEKVLQLDSIDNLDAVNIGRIATEIAIDRKLPVAIEVRIGGWVIYHASLPGSTGPQSGTHLKPPRSAMLTPESDLGRPGP